MSFSSLAKNEEQLPKVLKGSQTQGRVQRVSYKITTERYTPSLGKGSEYAVKYKAEAEAEERAYQTSRLDRDRLAGTSSSLNTTNDLFKAEELTSVGTVANINELEREELTQVYHNYNFNTVEPPSEHLEPIHNEREQVLKMINANQVCIIKGPTGCGKSTQVPQFILDFHASQKTHCNIVVSQPRRIAAISLAKRVCEERKWEVGTLVGYQVGLDKKATNDTRLLYCTTGVLLEKLIAKKDLNEFTHIILDEVHERDEDMDFAMLVAKRFLRTNSPNVKVILMSATMQTNRFAKYFEVDLIRERQMAPFYEINPQSQFNVYVNYIDDFKVIIPSQEPIYFDYDKPGIPDEFYDAVLSLMVIFNKIDDADYVNKKATDRRGAVLIFLPGLHQIETLYDKLSKKDNDGKTGGIYQFWLCPLHSSITKEEQEKVRMLAPPGKRKIILSTNIAESSLTIPDVKYVIDFCLTKHLVADPVTGFSSLQLAWASHTNCIQRQGRVGRVQDGRVYRMVSKEFYDTQMKKESVPEMQRCPLDIIVLKCKKLMEDECPIKLISCALDPPDLDNYQKTIQKLKEVGALLPICNGEDSDEDGDLTFMGKVMASLPLDIRVTKLILLGHIFDVLKEAIIIGSCMTVRNVFSETFQDRITPYNNKLLWADVSESDSIAAMNAYLSWRYLTGIGKFSRDPKVSNESSWARRFMLQIRHLQEVAKLEEDITKRLKNFNIGFVKSADGKGQWRAEQKPLIIKLVLAGAFYPHYYYRRAEANETANFQAMKELGGYDPNNHVYFKNMPQPAPLYFDTVKSILSQAGVSNDVSLHYNSDSSKIFVEFKPSSKDIDRMIGERKFNGSVPGDIAMPVYRAIKMRQQNIPIKIKLKKKNPYMSDEELKRIHQQTQPPVLPEESSANTSLSIALDTEIVEINVTHVENAGEFYGQLFPNVKENVVEMDTILNRRKIELSSVEKPDENIVYAAPYLDFAGDSKYYRAKVINKREIPLIEVFFIDYGNKAKMPLQDLKTVVNTEENKIIQSVPPLALKCVLAQVKPSVWHGAKWSEGANNLVKSLICDKIVVCKIYSFVNGVAAVDVLFGPSGRGNKTINKVLLDRTWAEEKLESYFSSWNHMKREEAITKQYSLVSLPDNEQGASYNRLLGQDFKIPQIWTVGNVVELKGPYSPLEMKLGSMLFCSTNKTVMVEPGSVNSVLLDTDPEDPHLRLLVAGTVSQSTDNSTLIVNDTTVLPNMNGLAALICLLFTPCAELRTNAKYTHYTGALCGLGANSRGQPLFVENDMEVVFDAEITEDDLLMINKIRYWINSRYRRDSEFMQDHEILVIKKEIRQCITKLLQTKRSSIKMCYNSTPNVWNQIQKENLKMPIISAEVSDFNSPLIYKLHYGIEMDENNGRQEVLSIQSKLRAVDVDIRRNVAPRGGNLRCPLCETEFQYFPQFKMHLQSTRHKVLVDWIDARAQKLGLGKTHSKAETDEMDNCDNLRNVKL